MIPIQKSHNSRLFTNTFLAQNQTNKILIIEVASALVFVQFRNLETSLTQFSDIESQTIAFPVQDLGCCPCLANEDECLVLSQVTIEILTDDSLKSTELFPHVHWLHAQEVVKVSMQLTYLCHGLHFYADVLFQLAGTNVTREYQGHIVGINQFQESRALHVRTGRLLELVSRKIYLCKNRLLDLLLVVHCR